MRTLLRGGLVIDTEPEVVARQETDVLIEDGRIAAVGPGLIADVEAAGVEVIDATERIVLPGFVDTHRHLWQTALRGVAADGNLGLYFERGARRVRCALPCGGCCCGQPRGCAGVPECRDHHGAGLFTRAVVGRARRRRAGCLAGQWNPGGGTAVKRNGSLVTPALPGALDALAESAAYLGSALQ